MCEIMKKIFLLFSIVFCAFNSLGQQVSVQNNELKYRISSGAIKTAADKDLFQSKINSLSSRIVSDSIRLNSEATNIDNLQGDRNALFDSVSIHRNELNLKAPKANPTFTGTVSGITKAMVGLGNADNTSDANKPISTATQTALNLKADKATTVNGYALSGNVTIGKADVGLESVPNIDATNPANITQTSNYRFTTDTEKSTWNGKENVLTFSSPLSRATNTVSLPVATSSANGYLSSTDWSTFNGKFATPSGLTSGTLPKWGGSSFSNSVFSDNGTLATISTDVNVNGIKIGRGSGNNQYNSVFGISALFSNVNGSGNIAIGRQSLFSLTDGKNNVGIGNGALYGNILGNFNTAIGVYSGRYIADGVTEITSVNNSVFIGSNTKSLADNQSNQIVVGNGATGNGQNRAVYGNSSITDSRVYGNLLLGSNTNSGELLQVNGTSKLAGNTDVTGTLTSTALQTGLITSSSSFQGSGSVHTMGTATSDASALLTMVSTSKGFLPPRMTQAQRNAIASPAEGLMIYQTDGTKGWYGYNGSAWVILN